MSKITVGTAITGGPTARSLQPRQRALLKFGREEEMVTIVTSRPLGGGKFSVVFITDDAITLRMEYSPSSGTGSVVG